MRKSTILVGLLSVLGASLVAAAPAHAQNAGYSTQVGSPRIFQTNFAVSAQYPNAAFGSPQVISVNYNIAYNPAPSGLAVEGRICQQNFCTPWSTNLSGTATGWQLPASVPFRMEARVRSSQTRVISVQGGTSTISVRYNQ